MENAATQNDINAARPPINIEHVEVAVAYLPSPTPFHQKYAEKTEIGAIRTDAMEFFTVKDYQDRNIHKFFLEFDGRVLINLNETLQQLLGTHRHEARFNLIEQITQG